VHGSLHCYSSEIATSAVRTHPISRAEERKEAEPQRAKTGDPAFAVIALSFNARTFTPTAIDERGLYWFRRKRREEIAEAEDYLGSFGDYAYQRVRREQQEASERGDDKRASLLERICKDIARRTGVDR